jgi:7-cyano-7-deazaguanine reductase
MTTISNKYIHEPNASPLGKNSAYITSYDASLLFPIPRSAKRDEIGVPKALPFHGYDTWNAFELSWLNNNGKPNVSIVRFDIPCTSTNIIESKSFKLYLNSFNDTKFNNVSDVHALLVKDISEATKSEVGVHISSVDELSSYNLNVFQAGLLDDLDVVCDTYTVCKDYLSSNEKELVQLESLYSNLLKSNCLVTGQPDWGSVLIEYSGPKIDREGLLKYIVSFRHHNEFHEQCVEKIFMDILLNCKPTELTVHARYTRRGGIDINPMRCTHEVAPSQNIRMPRQ